MTILAPGTPYWWVRCTDHGLVYEDTNRAFADAVWREHEGCAGRERYYRLNGAPEPPRSPMLPPAYTPLPVRETEGGLESSPTNGGSSAAQSADLISRRSQIRVLPSVPTPGDERANWLASQSKSNKRDMGSPQALGFRGRLTATSWEPPKPDMAIEDWLAEVRLLWTLRDRLQWALGDSLLWGETRYGEMWSQVADQYNHHTLENCRWVASRFPVARRRGSLSFAHHETVAKLEPVEQDVWLDKAEAESLPRAELRKALKGEQPEPETHKCPLCGREHRAL